MNCQCFDCQCPPLIVVCQCFLCKAPMDVLAIIDGYTASMFAADMIEDRCHVEAVHAMAHPGNQEPVTGEMFSPNLNWLGEPYLPYLLMENCYHVLSSYDESLHPYVEERLFKHYCRAEKWLRYLFDFMADYDCDTNFFEMNDDQYTAAYREALLVGEVDPPGTPYSRVVPTPHLTEI